MNRITATLCCFFASTATFADLPTPSQQATQGALVAPTQLVTALSPFEFLDPILVQNGNIWVGQIKESDDDSFKLEVYDQDGTRRLDVAILSHSVIRLIPLGNNKVAVLGRTAYPFVHRMTVATLQNGKIKTSPMAVPGDFTTNVTLHNGKWFGVDPSDAAFFAFERTTAKKFPSEYSMPDRLIGIGDEMWIVEKRNMGAGDEVLSHTNLSTGVRKSLFPTTRNGLYNITKSKDDRYIIATATWEQNVFLVEASTKTVKSIASIEQTPFGVTQMGNCFVTANGESHTLSVFHIDNSSLKLLETWDISSAGDRLKSATQIDYDHVNKSVIVKSSYMCPSCSVTQASVYRVKAPNESNAAAVCGI